MNLFDLEGKVAVVTGGNGGLGLGMAEDITSLGASIVISGRNLGEATTAPVALRNHGAKTEFVAADVSKKAECQALIANKDNIQVKVIQPSWLETELTEIVRRDPVCTRRSKTARRLGAGEYRAT